MATLPRRQIAMGDIGSFVEMAKQTSGIEAVIWNERSISLLTLDPSREITFTPEIEPDTQMFFEREHKREQLGFGEVGPRVWEGDFEPVVFTKKDLLTFLKNHTDGTGDDNELVRAVRNMKIRQSRDESELMLDDDSDDVRRVEVEKESVNIPKHFTLMMPLTEGISMEVQFEAGLHKVKKGDYYDKDDGKTKRIDLRAVNARKVLRGLMEVVLARLPGDAPRLYGATQVVQSGDRR